MRTVTGNSALADTRLNPGLPELLPSLLFEYMWTQQKALAERNHQEYPYLSQAIESFEKLSKECLK